MKPASPRSSRPPVVVVTGPTASGKSALALRLARHFDGEIVNADSMQVFRYMDIGTAKPSPADRALVPHHLFDVVDPDEVYSAGRYAQDARAAAARIHERGRVVFLTGGTGLYIRAFLEGLVETGAADRILRERLEAEQKRAAAEGDPARLHRRLAEFDPDAADRIHPNDVRRTVRALEILQQSGRPASSVQASHAFTDRPFRVLHLALDPGREALAFRIDRRCDAMIEAGLLREVRALRERGYGPELRPMQAIGYRHIQPVVDGSDTLVNALAAMKVDTRRFARRQRTWLRAVPEAIWLDPSDPDAVVAEVERFLEPRASTASAARDGAAPDSKRASRA
ncbi:MAG TPA: tRNA (adenosine(37)-N6)-dimethylallyltransferase MiaA [Myxococcota bacterium]|nr:tRNA (adenosine(37)-N6)-dimethylallyltransferase MiaA [Myxococcota bacterium]